MAKQGAVGVTVRQLGSGKPLPSAQSLVFGVDEIVAVWPTQTQTGGGSPNANARFISDPAVAAAVYSRMDVDAGLGRQPLFVFCTDKVADIKTAMGVA